MANNVLETKKLLTELNTVLQNHLKILSEGSEKVTQFLNSYKPSGYIKGVQELATNQEKVSSSNEKLVVTSEKVNREEEKRMRQRVQQIKLEQKREKAFDRYEKQLEREARYLQRTTGLYNQIQKRVNKLTGEYNNLAAKKALNGKLTRSELSQLEFLEKQLNKYGGVLKKVDANIGKHQRNVGNYRSAYDGLGFSVAQITREMPAFANSLQTGFMAISNNIPIFADEVARTAREVKALRAEGKPTQSVLSRLASSFFSFQTLLSVGVVLLTVYGKHLVEWAGSALGASSSMDKLKENTAKLNKESAQLSSQTIPQFQALVKISQDVTKSEKERADAIAQLTKDYPDFNAEILKESDNTDLVNASIAEYINKLGQKAKAQASMNMIQEKYNELILKEQETQQFAEENILKVAQAQNSEIKTVEQAVNWYKAKSYEIEKVNKNVRASEIRTNSYQSSLDTLNKKQAEGAKIQQEISDLMDIYIDNVDLSTQSTKKSGKSNEEQRKQIDGVKVAYKGLTDELKEYLNQDPTANIDEQNDALQRQKKIMLELQKATRQYLDNFSEDFINNSPLSGLLPFIDGTFQDLMEGADTMEEKFAVTFNAITEAAQQAFTFIDQMGQRNFEAQVSRLDAEKENALLFAGESSTAREEIDRQYEEKRAQIQKRQAEAQQKQAIFNTLVNTAQAAISAYATQLQPGDPTSIFRAKIAAAVTTALGLAQVALISSQEIPQFAEGVRDFSGGLAILGDGGKHEYVTDKHGKFLGKSPKTDTLVNLPKGANVYKDFDNFLNEGLLYSNLTPLPQIPANTSYVGLTKEELNEVTTAQTAHLAKALRNIPTPNIFADDKGLYKYSTTGNVKKRVKNTRGWLTGNKA